MSEKYTCGIMFQTEDGKVHSMQASCFVETAKDAWKHFHTVLAGLKALGFTPCGTHSFRSYRVNEGDETIPHLHICGECGTAMYKSADDLAWLYEVSAFMPCGHDWQWLNRAMI